MTLRLKIYGERNSGTNYLSRLIARNLVVEELPGVVPDWLFTWQRRLPGDEWLRDLYFGLTERSNLGWKHAQVRTPESMARMLGSTPAPAFVTLTKNPYSWLLSLHRRPYHQAYASDLSFEEFLVRPWHPLRRERVHDPTPSPVALWNRKNASYRALAEGPLGFSVCHLRYEDLLADPAAVIGELGARFDLELRSTTFENVVESTKSDRGRDFDHYRDYYLGEHWRAEISPNALERINARLDAALLETFGYARLD